MLRREMSYDCHGEYQVYTHYTHGMVLEGNIITYENSFGIKTEINAAQTVD